MKPDEVNRETHKIHERFEEARQGGHICSLGHHLFFQAPFSNDLIGTFRPAGAGDGARVVPTRSTAPDLTACDFSMRAGLAACCGLGTIRAPVGICRAARAGDCAPYQPYFFLASGAGLAKAFPLPEKTCIRKRERDNNLVVAWQKFFCHGLVY